MNLSLYLLQNLTFRTFCIQGRMKNALRDKFMCGFHSERVQNKVLIEENLTLKSTGEIIVIIETAAQESGVHKMAAEQTRNILVMSPCY